MQILLNLIGSTTGPSILRPPIIRTTGLIILMVLTTRSTGCKIKIWYQNMWTDNQGGLKINRLYMYIYKTHIFVTITGILLWHITGVQWSTGINMIKGPTKSGSYAQVPYIQVYDMESKHPPVDPQHGEVFVVSSRYLYTEYTLSLEQVWLYIYL